MLQYHKTKGIEYNPLQSSTYPFVEKDCNLVVLAPTSSGKTIVAEQFMIPTMEKGRKALYLSPLKALTSEKLALWEDLPFSRVAFTSDHSRPGIVVPQDLILMTTECLDSKSRGARQWLTTIGCLVADEAHMIAMPKRGDAFEVGLTRFSSLNPSARIIFLSATIPNADELGEWLTVLNGKPTEVVKTDWRPVVQEHLFIRAPDRFWDFITFSEQKCRELLHRHKDEQVLIFVHSIGTGRMLAKALDIPFHYSRLSKNERAGLEEGFRLKKVRAMVSTSTLAYGINLPADVGVIVGAHRGPTLVEPADIKQMAGRIGRYGLSSKGTVYYIFSDWYFNRMRRAITSIPPIKSVLPDRLYFHLVSFVAREKMGLPQIKDFLSHSLAAQQYPLDDYISQAVDLLTQYKIIHHSGSTLTTSPIGRAAALMYVDPLDLFFLKRNLEPKPMSPTQIAKAFAGIPSLEYDTYVPDGIEGEVKMRYGAQTLLATGLYQWLTGKQVTDLISTVVFNFTQDIDRIISALKIAGLDKVYLDNLALMLKNGVQSQYLELITIPGIGRKRAERLWKSGIRTKNDLIENEKVAKNVLGPKLWYEATSFIKDPNKIILKW